MIDETRSRPVFHTIGDSHAQFPWHAMRGVRVNWLGPLLCHSARRMEMPPGVRAGDVVCVCLGEIDCRCHVHKHVSRQRSYTVIIDDLVEGLVTHLCGWDRAPDVKLAVLNVPPPPRRRRATKNPELPFVGSDAQRRKYVRYFNRRAAEACEREGLDFLDVYDQYADGRGYLLPPPAGDGHVHLLDPAPLRRAVEERFDIRT